MLSKVIRTDSLHKYGRSRGVACKLGINIIIINYSQSFNIIWEFQITHHAPTNPPTPKHALNIKLTNAHLKIVQKEVAK